MVSNVGIIMLLPKIPPLIITSLAPDALTDVLVGTITATTVSISWTAPTISNPNSLNSIQRYEVELSEDQFNISTIMENTTSNSITITGLEEYNTYQCKVAAVNGVAIGTFSSVVNFTTSEAGRYIIFVESYKMSYYYV